MRKYTIEELVLFTPDELNEMVTEQEISMSEWVEAQPDTYGGYAQWLAEKGLERCDASAQLFAIEVEDSMAEDYRDGTLADFGDRTIDERHGLQQEKES